MLILCRFADATIWIGSPKRQVLAVYERPYDEQFPVVCVDESPKQLIGIEQYRLDDGTRLEDSEYVRHGVGQIYMAFEPLAGQRFVEVKDDHKAITWVGVLANLLDGPYATCLKMTVVGDNLTGPPLRCSQTKCFLYSFWSS